MANLSDTLVNGDLRVTGNIYGTTTSALSAGSTSITTGSTAGITLSAGQKFTLAAGGSTAAFTMPSAPTAVAYASSAGSATKLTASRNIITNLGSTAAASFNGTADISAGVTGTLPVKYGGTGATAAADARTNLGITPANIGAATTTHTHGNILSGGTITADTTIANGAKIAFIDTNNKVSRGAATFDASTTTKALSQKGTFETFSKLTLGSGSANAASGTHTHTTSIASGSTAGITLTAGKSFTLSAGGTTTAFTMPSAPTAVAYASSAGKIGSVTVGGSNQPIYLNGGVPTAANAYAGGTSLTLNGTSKSAATASIYAPTATGTAGYILKSNGANSAPTWIAQSALNGSNVGSSSCPVYINAAGQPTQISHCMQLQPANSSGSYDAYVEVRASGDNVCADIDAVYITGANDSRVGVWVKPSANKGTWLMYMNKDMTTHIVGDELKKMAYDSANTSGYFEGYVTWSPTIKKMVVGTLSTDPNTISFA